MLKDLPPNWFDMFVNWMTCEHCNKGTQVGAVVVIRMAWYCTTLCSLEYGMLLCYAGYLRQFGPKQRV